MLPAEVRKEHAFVSARASAGGHPPARELGAEGGGREAAALRRGVRDPDRARAATRPRCSRPTPGPAPVETAACSTGSTSGCRSSSPPASRRSAGSCSTTSRQATRCTGCCRARSAPARRSSRCARCCESSTPAGRRPCWRRPRCSRSSTTARSPRCSASSRQGGMLGGADDATQVALLTGSLGAAARREAMLDAASGSAGIVIGTHALLEEKVQFADLGLVVVDEQHRFGVEQRAALTAKSDAAPPHVLVMTATPIPRTVAMTVFGDLETSTLAELPAGRAPIQTNVVPLAEQPAWLERAHQRIREEVGQGPPGLRRLPADRRRPTQRRHAEPDDDGEDASRVDGGRRGGRPAARRAARCAGCAWRCCTAGCRRPQGRGDARVRRRRHRRAGVHDGDRGRRRRRRTRR